MSNVKHARYSPSKLEFLESCIRFEYKEMEDGAAEEGTELHKAYETGDLSGLTEEQRMVVTKALLYAEGVRMEAPVTEEHKETQLTLSELTYGFADHIIIQGCRGHVLDFKAGRKGATEAENNFQVQCYAGGMFEQWPELTEVVGHIVDPRASETPSRFMFTRDDLSRIRARVEQLYARIMDPFNPPTPTPELCGKCARAARCPALNQTVALVARGLNLPLPSALAPNAVVSPTDRLIAQQLKAALSNWCEQVGQQNLEFVGAGGEIPGVVLRTRSTGVRIPREATPAAVQKLQEAGFPMELILQSSSISIKEMAEAFVAVSGGSVAEAKEKIKQAVVDMAVEGSCRYLQLVKPKKEK